MKKTQPQCRELGSMFDTRLFKALCDPNRLAILTRLTGCCEAATVTQVAGCCPIDISVVSRHLAVLREAGILEATKKGRRVFYAVRFSQLAQTLRDLADAIDACCPAEPARNKEKKNATK